MAPALKLQFFVEDNYFQSFAIYAVVFHGVSSGGRIHHALSRFKILRLKADRDFVSGDSEMNWFLDRVRTKQIGMSSEAGFPFHGFLDLR
jgi:hypothetical protein